LRLIVPVADGEWRGRVGFDGGDGNAHGDDHDNGDDDDDVDGDLVHRYVVVVSVVNELCVVRGKVVILASQGKVQGAIVLRGRRGKQDVPAHKGYRK
jgi:hypothetical protein